MQYCFVQDFQDVSEKNKLTHILNGKMLYKYTLDMVLSCGIFEKIIIVSQYEEILNNSKGALPIKNNESLMGISSSVKLGCNESNADFYMFFTCDQPFIKRETILDFYKEFTLSQKGIGFIKRGNSFGIPAIFSKKFRKEILNLSGDTGAKSIWKNHSEDTFFYNAENFSEFIDCDTKEDFIYIEKLFSEKNF